MAGSTVRVRGKGKPMASEEDVNGDGLLDLVVHVDTLAFDLSAVDTEATLSALLFDGTEITGSDSIRIVPE
ncbi:MAG: hypothetical protein IH945_06060 [Armatimonadetes bacterium]|nr:hypothetical protein [Armatimonadota bacterium]